MDKVRTLMLPFWRPIMRTTRNYCYDKKLKNLVTFPEIRIGQGKLKYIIAKVFVNEESGQSKIVIRGVPRVKYHFDVYDQLQKEASAQDLCTECLGGGQMVHDNDKKYIKIYGRLQKLGKADHRETREILRANSQYTSYNIDAESAGMDI